MSEPVIADRRPAVIELEPGTYWWCRCGQSQKQPFCDGTHKQTGTPFRPEQLILTEKKRVALCNCKRTANAPHCDGTHAKLS